MNSLVQSINSEAVTRLGRGLVVSTKFANIMSAILIVLIIYMLAIFGWSLWDYFQPRPTININSLATKNTNQPSKLNINQLTAFNLFGDTKAVKQINNNQLDAPVTRLKLKLRGVYSASDEQLAGAMIEAQNKQDVYRVGSNLPGAAGLKLHKIMADRVIMSRGGKFETLLIEDFGQSSGRTRQSNNNRRNNAISNLNTSAQSPVSSTIDKRNDLNLASEIGKLRTNLSDPQSLSELVAVAPAMNGDQFEGFRLTPGKNRALFSRLGLRRNDVVTTVNGISLDDPSSAFSLMEQIKTADEISLTVKRGGKEMNIIFGAQ